MDEQTVTVTKTSTKLSFCLFDFVLETMIRYSNDPTSKSILNDVKINVDIRPDI